ncbi:unnamed protein product [Adineta steineri]|uniref:Uncharacterized protein n=1 Tax=Adineta steineri TaxID=433720 RepID=A0A818TP53_9BILA|nr:unnamed protein product [Adineta steineri]CAF1215996.1 unnamed protein product [Adineta steineri]CAF3689847.1 unnamed protein product [Adineta steineri]CAF3771280.1 unnamed protein product [Adineta steineri]
MGFKERFPRWITLVLAILQLILTAAIAGLEFGSFYYDVAHGTIWAGFWSSLVFILTFIMMFIITCCCRGRCCATYLFILNVMSGALACVIIYFDVYFQDNICKCYLGDNLCCALRDIKSFNSAYGDIAKNCTPIYLNGVQTVVDPCYTSPPTAKYIFLKAQIGCSVGMLVTCGLYVLSYLFACCMICFGHD